EVPSACEGDEVEVITDRTPFYGESGGQQGDQGILSRNGFRMEVSQCSKPLPDLIVHHGMIREGWLNVGDVLSLKVSPENRGKTALNHTATHLLQAALRKVLGDHVKQAGSLVSPGRLRFDFTHFGPLTEEEITRAEVIVNEQIRRNLEVCVSHITYKAALEKGAMALFGEKYGEVVRLVQVGEVSAELCGGTHTRRSGDIGLFKIVSESGVAAGVRRIEALTGEEAWKALKEEELELKAVAAAIKAKPGEVAEKVQRLLRQQKELEKKLENLQGKISGGQVSDLVPSRSGGGRKGHDSLRRNPGFDSKVFRAEIDSGGCRTGGGERRRASGYGPGRGTQGGGSGFSSGKNLRPDLIRKLHHPFEKACLVKAGLFIERNLSTFRHHAGFTASFLFGKLLPAGDDQGVDFPLQTRIRILLQNALKPGQGGAVLLHPEIKTPNIKLVIGKLSLAECDFSSGLIGVRALGIIFRNKPE
ncbi:MAG: alanyl-tRNA synthetase, partial [Deltaproteobacteria bacterium]|nr:alanyl-tRNA synthetase [Deltaproteobacteria bacterium]